MENRNKNTVGDYLICKICKHTFFCCHVYELLLPHDCEECGSKNSVELKIGK